jgi:hypothetical protein
MRVFINKKRLFIPKFYLPLALLICLAGCNAPKSQLTVFNSYYRAADFNEAIIYAQSRIGRTAKPDGEDLLWSLQAAATELQIGDCNKSAEFFDKAEAMLNYYDFQNETAAAVASTIVNDNAVAYLGEEYDGIMVNTYKALDFMVLGKNDLARVEFNRALDRQTRAKVHFVNEIAKLKNQVAKEQESKKDVDLKKNMENPKVQEILKKQYPSLYEYQAYPDFVNPFTTYLAGVCFNLMQDAQKAVDLLKESAGMVPGNQYVAEDFAATENFLQGRGRIENTVWVIFENGLGPTKEELRVDLPLFLVTDKVRYVGIALPKLVPGSQAYANLIVNAGGKEYRTEVVADMERVIQTEFKKDFQGILTRALVSATVKAAAQYAVEQQNNNDNAGKSFLSLMMTAYSYATTAADVRIWTTLPKDFQVARLRMPPDRNIAVFSPEGAKILDCVIAPCSNAIVYVKIPFKTAAPFCGIIKSSP